MWGVSRAAAVDRAHRFSAPARPRRTLDRDSIRRATHCIGARARARAPRESIHAAAVDRVRPAQLWEASLESDVLGVLAVISFEWRDTAVYCHAVATSPAYRSRAGSSGSLQAGSASSRSHFCVHEDVLARTALSRRCFLAWCTQFQITHVFLEAR